MISLGWVLYEFFFDSYDDMSVVWASGTVNMKPEILRLSQWSKDFIIQT